MEPVGGKPDMMFYGGLAGVGVGAVLIGVGTVFGLKRSGLGSGPSGETQLQVIQRIEDAESAASKANKFLLLGTLVGGAGGGILAWQMLGAQEGGHASLAPIDGGLKAQWSLKW